MVINTLELEIRREVISLLLSWDRKIQGPLSGGHIKKFARDFSFCASQNINRVFAHIATPRIFRELNEGVNPLLLISQYVPLSPLQLSEGNYPSIKEDSWEEWLKICWGFDDFILGMLSLLRSNGIHDLQEFISISSEFPYVLTPIANRRDLIDAHIHAGAVPLSIQKWENFMNDGDFSGFKQEEKGIYPDGHYTPLNWLGVGRILLATMLDIYDYDHSMQSVKSIENFADNRYELLNIIKNIFQNNETRSRLSEFLAGVLKSISLNISVDRTLRAAKTDELFNISTYEFFRKEKTCLAAFLWFAYRDKLPLILNEIFISYLRCKGQWLQAENGSDAKLIVQGNIGLQTFGILKENNNLIFLNSDPARFHAKMADTLHEYYSTQKLARVDIRLASMERGFIERRLNWLEKVFNGINWRLILSLRRFSDDVTTRGLSGMEIENRAREFVTGVMQSNSGKFLDRIDGIDVLGEERDSDWRRFVPVMKKIREFISVESGRSCFISFHCGEDTVMPLKGILDIWYVFKSCGLEKGDRIGHALDLLNPNRRTISPEIPVNYRQWNLMQEIMGDLLDELENQDLYRLFKELQKTRNETNNVDLNGPIAFELASLLHPFICQELIRKEIIIEVCPTSNWRIAGVPTPTSHPVMNWVNLGGKYLIGTDDPAIFPCTIEGEHVSVDLSINNLNGQRAYPQRVSE